MCWVTTEKSNLNKSAEECIVIPSLLPVPLEDPFSQQTLLASGTKEGGVCVILVGMVTVVIGGMGIAGKVAMVVVWNG